MKQKVVIVEEDQSIYEEEIDESEIPTLLSSGFISAILKSVEEGIEYVDIEYETKDIDNVIATRSKVVWKVPHKKDE